MSTSRELIELRKAASEVAADMRAETNDGQIDITLAIARLRQDRAPEVEKVRERLINDALAKLFNDVGRRTGLRTAAVGQPDLFAGLKGLPFLLNVGDRKLKDPTKMKFAEALAHLETASRRDTEAKTRKQKFKKLVEELTPYRTHPDDTLEDAARRRAEAEGSRQAELDLRTVEEGKSGAMA